jgi:hypothetical protein
MTGSPQPESVLGAAATVKRHFPADIWSLKGMDLELWAETQFWPVSDLELREVYGRVDAILAGAIADSRDEAADGLCVLFNVLSEYLVTYLHARWVLARTARAGESLVISARTRLLGSLAGGKGIERPDWLARLPKTPTWRERVRYRVRVLRDSLVYHRLDWRYWLGKGPGPAYLCFHAPSPDKRKFAASRGRKIRILHPRRFMCDVPGGDRRPAAGDERAVGLIAEGLDRLAAELSVPFPPSERGQLADLMLGSIRSVCASIASIQPLVRPFAPTSILLDGLGNLFKRCFLVAARREGHHIVGFTHGNTVGMGNVATFSYVEIGMLDTYVVASRASAAFFDRLQRKFPLRPAKPAEIVAIGEEKYRELWAAGKSLKPPAEVKTVMFLEAALTGYMDRDTCFFWPFQVDLIVRTAKALRQRGIRTILKRHPDRLAESQGLYDPYFDEVLEERFESVHDRADAFFFPLTSSTTFGFSLLTNKPVLFFDRMLETIWQDMHSDLAKRCRIIPSWFDRKGRLAFDESALIEAVLRKPEPPDDGFAKEFMLDMEP